MIDRNPWLNFISHAVLVLGVAIVAFPLFFMVAWPLWPSEWVSQPLAFSKSTCTSTNRARASTSRRASRQPRPNGPVL